MTAKEYGEFLNNVGSESEHELMRSIGGGIDYDKTQNKDIPDGTITTQPYFNDLLIPVALK